MTKPLLFSPFDIRGLTLKKRIASTPSFQFRPFLEQPNGFSAQTYAIECHAHYIGPLPAPQAALIDTRNC
jgi:2,4-dienoyl-CoA reductase-like NADH-dependent reductase (Old Yellow Enzyme family)